MANSLRDTIRAQASSGLIVWLPALAGWRLELFGEKALALKHGKLALAIEKGKVAIVQRE